MNDRIKDLIDERVPPKNQAMVAEVVAAALNLVGGDPQRALKIACSVALDCAMRLGVAMSIAEQYLPNPKRVGRPPKPGRGVHIPTKYRHIFRKSIGAPKRHDLPLPTVEIARMAVARVREYPGTTARQAASDVIVQLGGVAEPRFVANVERRVGEILRRACFP